MRDLYCDNIEAKPISTFWGDESSETGGNRFNVVNPPFFRMEPAQLFEWADGMGVDLLNDPRELARHELVGGLESIGVACYDEESDELLAEAYADSMLVGDLDGVDRCTWADELTEHFEMTEQPAMSYRYPVSIERAEGDESDAAAALDGLPLCLVYDEDEEEYFLALTGGGMDLSAEICKAYIALGQRPPVHFCDLPRMAGRKYPQEFIQICIESCEVAGRWTANKILDLTRLAVDEDYAEPFEVNATEAQQKLATIRHLKDSIDGLLDESEEANYFDTGEAIHLLRTTRELLEGGL